MKAGRRPGSNPSSTGPSDGVHSRESASDRATDPQTGPVSRLIGLATSTPAYPLTQAQVKARWEKEFGETTDPELLAVFDHAGVETRYFAFPPEYYLADHPFGRRNQDYIQVAARLAEEATSRCLDRAGRKPEEVDHLLLVTTTGLATPSLDAHLAQRLPFRSDIRRTPLFGVGCAGGAVGLARAFDLAAGPERVVLLVSVELCSLHFRPGKTTPLHVVGAALFGDGASAALLGPGEGPTLVASQSYLFPDSLEVMGWEFSEQGMDLVLSPALPSLVRREMRPLIEAFLDRHALDLLEMSHFIIHPGGAKVLEAYGRALELSDRALAPSREFLRDYGNLSSASVLFILEKLQDQVRPVPGEHGLLIAVGPGFAAELLLLRW